MRLEADCRWGWLQLGKTRFGSLSREWCPLGENHCRAYEITRNSKFKVFGDLMGYPQYCGTFTGEIPLDPHGFHAYSHVNTHSSAALTCTVTRSVEATNCG